MIRAPYISQQRIELMDDILIAAGWKRHNGGFTPPADMADVIALECGRGSLHRKTAIAAQARFDEIVIEHSSAVTPDQH